MILIERWQLPSGLCLVYAKEGQEMFLHEHSTYYNGGEVTQH